MRLVSLTLGLLFSFSLMAASPTTLKIKVYQFAASTSVDCSNPVTVFEDTNPAEVDMIAGPKMGGGTLDVGEYKCILIRMSDIITFTPDSDTTNCTAGQSYSIDVCSATASMTTTNLNSDGTISAATNCTGTSDNNSSFSENIVTLYLTTGSSHDPAVSGGNQNSFVRPAEGSTTTTNSLKLQNSWIVGKTGAGKFIANGTDKVFDAAGGNCALQPPVFSFQNNI